MDNNNKIIMRQSHMVLPDYIPGSSYDLEKLLTVYDDYHRADPIGYNYTEDGDLIIPRGLDVASVETLTHRVGERDKNIDKPETMILKLLAEPRDDFQRKGLAFLLGEDKFSYTKKYSQVSLNLPPGDGKTFITVAYSTFIKEKIIVITHLDRLKEQWKKSFLEFTNIDEDEIYNIESSNKLASLLNSKTKLPFKVYLVNHATLHSYGNRYGWENITELFKKIGVGVKVYDEAHLSFKNILEVDLVTNTKKTIYLTATFERSNWKENKIFKSCFASVPKYGSKTIHEKRKHIIYTPVFYQSNPTMYDLGKMKTVHGFNVKAYCDYCMGSNKFFNVLLTWTNVTRQYEEKTLILVGKINACKKIADLLKESYPDKTVGILNSSIKDKERDKMLECDFIVSTIQSSGTGVDIKNLRFVINCEPYASKVIADQVSGRLRAIEGKDSMYIELVDSAFGGLLAMQEKRLQLLKKKCKEIKPLKI